MNRIPCPVGKLASPVGRVTSKAADRHKLREIVSVLFAAPAIAFAATATSELPRGGQVVTGLAQIASKGARMEIKQASSRAVIDWSSFNIGAQAQVHFDQPSGGASLNRVYDSKASQIYGKLSATGQVFLVNPNGVVFAPGAQVDVGGLVVSTLSIAKADFMSAHLKFEGDSSNAIVNQGNIKVATGGTAAFIAAKIINDGRIEAAKGNVLMAAGSKVTLDLGGPVKLQVDNSTLETLISNGGAIKADGGHVLLSSQAAATLASSVINNSGQIEAQALATGETGEIILYAHGGTTKISGSLDAKGGFIETSGQILAIANDTRIKARTWLIDPSDVVINTSSDAIGGASVGASVIQTALSASAGNTDVIIQADNTITVNTPLTWSANKLSLTAGQNIFINADLNATATASLAFLYGQSSTNGVGATYTVATGTKIYIPTGAAFTWKKGTAGLSKNLVLDNGLLRFGDGIANSFTTDGQLKQPFYFDNVAPRNNWYKLTFSTFPLDIAIGSGGSGVNTWNYNGEVLTTNDVSNQDTYAPKLSNRSLEISGYKEGIGTIVAANTITFTSTQTLKLENTYRLDASANYLKTVTAVSNTSASSVENLRLWIGTRDDFVGTSDDNFKLKGNLSSNGFEAISTQNQQAKAVRISESNDGVSGAAVLFYSTSTGADTSVDNCCRFSYSTNKDPRTSAISTPLQDGSYALFIRLNDIAPGQSDGMTWYYAAAPISQINSVVTAVAQQSATNVAFTLAPLSGSRDYKGSPYSLGSLWGSTDIFGSNYSTWLLGSDYTFQYAGNTVTGFTNAGSYNNIGINILKTGFQVAASGNTLGSLSISPAALTVSANAASKTYDGLSFSGGNGVSYNGFVNNETAAVLSGALAYAGTAQNASNAGNYSIIPSGLNANNGNYNLSFVNGNLTIAPRPIALTADAKSKLQGQVDPALSYSLACGNFTENCGLVAGETLAGSLKRVAGEAVRDYAIQQDTLSNQNNPNYLISYTEQNLSIAEAPGKPNAIASIQQSEAERNAISYIQQATRKPVKKASTASTDSTIDGPNISAGLAFVEIASSNETTNNSSVQGATLERGAGRDPAGFMRVFVVDGGINLPKELMPRSPTINDEELRRQPQR